MAAAATQAEDETRVVSGCSRTNPVNMSRASLSDQPSAISSQPRPVGTVSRPGRWLLTADSFFSTCPPSCPA